VVLGGSQVPSVSSNFRLERGKAQESKLDVIASNQNWIWPQGNRI